VSSRGTRRRGWGQVLEGKRGGEEKKRRVGQEKTWRGAGGHLGRQGAGMKTGTSVKKKQTTDTYHEKEKEDK